ncbi:MAG: acyl carrier protein [Bryobacterales bacterium]|nr:acyl carrier protein [Bryobacterales bacterium]
MHTTIRQYIVDNFLFGRANGLSDSESLLEQGVIDSIGLLELIGFLQKRFGIRVADEDIIPANLDSVDCIRNFVEGKLACN